MRRIAMLFLLIAPAFALAPIATLPVHAGYTIEHGHKATPPLCPDGSRIRPGNYCPGDIEVSAPPMEPTPAGATCADGYVFSADRTYCVPDSAKSR